MTRVEELELELAEKDLEIRALKLEVSRLNAQNLIDLGQIQLTCTGWEQIH